MEKLFKNIFQKEVNEVEKSVVAYANKSDSIDRSGDLIDDNAWELENFIENPVIPAFHKYDRPPIGRAAWTKVYPGQGLKFKVKFAETEEGETFYKLYSSGVMNAFSVGFIPKEILYKDDMNEVEIKKYTRGGKIPDRVFKKVELLEISAVVVPDHYSALVERVANGEITTKSIVDFVNEIDQDNEKAKIVGFVDLEKKKEEIVKEINIPDEVFGLLAGDDFISKEKEDIKKMGNWYVDIEFISSKENNEDVTKDSDKEIIEKTVVINEPEGELISDNVDIDETLIEKDQELEDVKESESEIDIDIIIEKELDDFNKEKQEVEIKKETDVIDARIKFFNSLKVKNVDLEKIKKEYVNDFDITQVRTEPAGFEYKIFTKYLGCKIKDIFTTDFFIPNAMKGNFLSAFKNVLSKHELLDQRNFYGNGSEIPLQHSVVKLNSKLEEEFLVTGTQFYKSNDGDRFVFQIYKNWGGLSIDIFTSNKNIELNKSFVRDAIKWVDENNYLKGEKFSIGGEFLEVKEIGWDDVIFPNDEAKDKIKKNIEKLSTKSPSRGMMFIGSPGTGKTLTGKILMNKADTTFIWASSKDFGWGAASALGIGFEMARTLAPSVFFLEDIDTWLSGYTVDLLKTEMDGIRENKGVLTILTSNFPEDIPDALIDRPGRFHHIINFSLPDEDNRIKLLKFFIKDADKDIITEFAKLTDGYSGAHLKELVEFAKMIAEDDGISIEEALIQSLEQMKEQRCLIQDLKNVDKKKDIGNNIETKSIDFIEIEIPVKKSESEVEFDFDAVQIKDIFVDKVKKTFDEIDLSDLVEDRIRKAKGIIEFED